MSAQSFRAAQLKELTDEIGVYALCDLDNVPIYVGQSVDGIRSRVRRHLTSARSDIIANRQVDVWEIAFVRAWPVETKEKISELEAYLYNIYDADCRLMNGKVVPPVAIAQDEVPEMQTIQVIDEDERQSRLRPENRLPRQISQYLILVDYILNVKNAEHLKRSLDAHFERLVSYHQSFLE
jgi:excinuclease UvrABC nuclease subunit